MSFLVMDVGNSRLKWALYEDAQPGAAMQMHGAVALEAIDDLYETAWSKLPGPALMLGCVVAAESVRARVEEQLQLWGVSPRWVKAQAHVAGLKNLYAHPTQLGADRWLAMVGALHRVAPRLSATSSAQRNPPAVVVMVGTAVTIDAIDGQQQFIGGLILPGFGLMLRALELGTAGLKVPSGEVRDFPDNTSDALMSGGSEAIAGAVERMCRHLRERTGQEPLLIISGGAASKLASSLSVPHQVIDTLIFEGLLQVQHHLRA